MLKRKNTLGDVKSGYLHVIMPEIVGHLLPLGLALCTCDLYAMRSDDIKLFVVIYSDLLFHLMNKIVSI